MAFLRWSARELGADGKHDTGTLPRKQEAAWGRGERLETGDWVRHWAN
ncbi:MAG: hypothetical protein ACYTG0_18945 [Planctomycetota bacterium]